eukprot:XP_019858449.1 PREDICTED: uncharacterized protein LOC109586678 [Amphimedon queenslandica]
MSDLLLTLVRAFSCILGSRPLKALVPSALIAAIGAGGFSLSNPASAQESPTQDFIGFTSLCGGGPNIPPSFESTPSGDALDPDALYLEADNAENAEGVSILSGRATAIMGAKRLEADRLRYGQSDRRLDATGNIRIDDEQLNRAVLRIAEQNRMSLRGLRDNLRREGLSFSEFRENLREDILISEIRRREVEPQINISGRDIDLYLSSMRNRKPENEIYRVRHLLVAISEDAAPDKVEKARMRMIDIIEKIRGGASFSQMAASHSDGQQALQCGDLGWRNLVDKRSDNLHIVEQTRARHILVTPDELTDDASARQQLTVLREQILAGADFEGLARARSDDVSSASKGGDLGWINPGETEPEFEQVMLSLNEDEISAPFQSRFGWHIVQVLERREHDDTEAALRAEAQRNLRQRKFEEVLELWLRRIRDEAYVEYRLDQ